MHKILLWGMVVVQMAVIFMFSAQPATQSKETSEGVANKIINALPNYDVTPAEEKSDIAFELNKVLRKLAHFFLYFALGIFVFLAIKYSLRNKSVFQLFLISVLICLAYSISDEVHQLFVDGRGAQVSDVLIDLAGSAMGIGLIAGFAKFRG